MVANEQILTTLEDIDENDEITYARKDWRFYLMKNLGYCINIFL